jgi:Thioredoxin like C-terminal domain/AhpC/TSA family
MEHAPGRGDSSTMEGRIPSLEGATGWLNTRPLTSDELLGKVVVVNFCTYTCINWLRTLPYVRAWAETYADRGLVTLGVHTPEFPFEKDVENVRRALGEMRVGYPVALDNDYAVWEAFSNHYWPALYFIDAEGNMRHHRFGEGDYERSELVIQELLAEAGGDEKEDDLVTVDGEGPEAAADWDNLDSPETYLGYERTQNLDAPGGVAPDEGRVYAGPQKLRLNHWALSGDWTVNAGNVHLNEPSGRIAFRFHARDVHLVMGPPAGTPPMPFRVFLDGRELVEENGSDVNARGAGGADFQRMYQLIRQRGPISDRTFEIEFLDRGADAFCFTFG